MSEEILQINPENLTDQIIQDFVYPDLDHHFYWSECWEDEFYVGLAWYGFISVSTPSGPEEWVLLPEIQKAYAVLDWEDLKVGRTCRRSLSRLAGSGAFTLSITGSTQAVISGIQQAYGSRSWLYPPYQDLMARLESYRQPHFHLLAVELRDSESRLRAGELGYVIGSVYTSLSGFLDRTIPGSDNLGKAQLYGLAGLLKNRGHAFWNLGHPHMQYKLDLGATILDRQEFLERWQAATSTRPERGGIQSLDGLTTSLSEALQMTGLFG